MPKATKIQQQSVKLTPVKKDLGGELAEKIYYECDFCRKTVGLHPEIRRVCERLSGDGFYCAFCLRNNFHIKSNRHILITSFRGVIGYYYYALYASPHRQLYLANLEDYISSHIHAGSQNPIFRYDPESYLWFIDFSRVGRCRKKIKLQDVNRTIVNVLTCFNLWDHIPNVRMHKLYDKYAEAVEKFHTQRYRPEGKRMCLPTLSQCFTYPYQYEQQLPKGYNLEDTRNFTPKDFILKN
jgi:hypothetical protein